MDPPPYSLSTLLPPLQPPHAHGGAVADNPPPPAQALRQRQEEHGGLQERVGSLQRALTRTQGEKREAERIALRLEKDKSALKKTLDKVRPWVAAPLGAPGAGPVQSITPRGTHKKKKKVSLMPGLDANLKP